MCAVCTYYSWYAPVDRLPVDLVAPFVNRVAFPWKYLNEEIGHEHGLPAAGLSMMGWLFLCDRFGSAIVQGLDSLMWF
jgi:hypothetical protein